jgi:hypothetical protein
MESFVELLEVVVEVLAPWFGLLVFVLLSTKMIDWARHRKAGAIAFGLFVQMFLPDPRAQITIESVVERKQEVKKQQDGKAEPDDEQEKTPGQWIQK